MAGTGTEAAGAIAAARQAGVGIVPLIATHGGAGGRVSAASYAAFRATLLQRLAGAGKLDGVYLALHGAFVAEGSDDVEGELLRDVRAIVGNVPVVVSCDLHAHITRAMLAHCDALTAYQLYPHDDAFETWERAMRLLLRLAGGARMAMRACRAPLLLPAQRQRTRGDGPMARIFTLARGLEAGGVHAVSYFPVQPWMDLPEMGFTTVAVADSAAEADAAAARITRAAWEARQAFQPVVLPPAEAIAAGLAADGLVVLADAADCVGGGATGDSAHAIAWLRRCAPAASAAIHLVDPETVAEARRHRPGARFPVALGNKQDPAYGAPLELEVELVSLSDGAFRYAGGLMGGVAASTGDTAVLRAGPVEIVVASLSAYEYADEVFLANGVDARGKKFVVAKNPMNYQAAYAEAAAHHIMDTPGPTTPRLAGLPWRRLDRPTYPLDPDCPPGFVHF
jgi:microcystin degradation protein MlrC